MSANLVNAQGRIRWTTWLGLVLVPVLIVGGLLWATWGSDKRMKTVRAAVVNQDVAVEVQGQLVPMGRQLTAALVDSDRQQNLAWEQATLSGGQAGLKTGEYAAMVVIPENFSAAATSYAGAAADAYSATIQVETSPVAGIADATLGRVVAQEAARVLNETLTSAYLDQIYIGFNQMGEQFVTLADAASQLSDGADQLADGTSQLADGLGQAASGVGQFANGVKQASDGTQQFATGIGQYGAGIDEFASGIGQYASGVGEFSDGVDLYAAGMNTLAAEVAPLPDGAAQLADGMQQVSDGVGQYVDGINQIVDPVADLLTRYPELAETIQQISGDQAGLDQAVAVMRQIQDAVAELEALNGLSTAELQALFPCPPPQAPELPMDCETYYRAIRLGIGSANQVLDEIRQNEDLGPIIEVLEELPDQLAGIQLPEGGIDLLDMVTQLRDGGVALKDGTAELAAGVDEFAAGMQPLVEGINQTADGAAQLADGATQLADGGTQLADGATQLAVGGAQLVDGANELADGMTQLSDGANELSDGMNQLADGGVELSGGAAQLADGMGQFADGIAEGKDQIPSYSDSDRETLSQVVASPVAAGNLLGTATVGTGWATALMVLALWAGALATFMVVQVLSKRLLTSALPSAYLVAAALLPGVIVVSIQAVAVTAIGQAAMGLPFVKLMGLLGISLLAALTFVAINHALVAWFGRVGRFISFVFVVVALAPMLTDAMPSLLASLRSISPMSPALDAMRSWITSSTGTVVAVFQLVLWLLAGLGASAAAIVKNRTTSLDALAKAQLNPD